LRELKIKLILGMKFSVTWNWNQLSHKGLTAQINTKH
jgi:hypothetical protein